MAIVHGDIGGAEPSTVTFKVDSVTVDQNSTLCHREVLVLGDPQSSIGYATVLAAAPASTEYGLTVRPVGYSTIVSVAALPANSSQVEVRGMPANSSLVQLNAIAAGLLSTAAPSANSSGLNVWLVGGNGVSTTVSVAAFPANSSQVEVRAMPANSSLVQLNAIAAGLLSTAAPTANSSGLNVWVVGGNGVSTTVSVAALPANSSQVEVRNTVTVTLGANLQSTALPAAGSSGIVVRPVYETRLTAKSTNAFSSTSFTVQSSAAGLATYVTAYSITSTVAASLKIAFYDGSTMLWPVQLQAVSSAMSGANLSAYPYLFKGDAARALTLQVPSSVAGVRVGVSYFQAP